MSHGTRIVVLLLMAVTIEPALAQLQVECVQGCLPRGEDQTVDLLLRSDESEPVTIRWSFFEDPAPGESTVTLYAGNPSIQDAISQRGVLDFANEDGTWRASRSFGGEELGRGTFLTVLTRKRGSAEKIVDWRAFRLLTAAEQQAEQDVPDPVGNWSLDVTPWVLQVGSGRGDLPRSRGGDQRVWWSLADSEGDYTDLDLDGEQTGVAGLGVQVSTPWHAGAGDSGWKQLILDKLEGVEGHTVRFGDMEWIERPPRELDLGKDADPVLLRQYYTVVTLYTAATIRTFDGKEVEGGSRGRTYFSHETSARLKHPRDPRFWASYSLREYGADRHLLEMLQQDQHDGTVHGLGRVQKDDGDGGVAVYSVGFLARVRPWQEQEGGLRAGFVGLDVVAARAGYGGVVTQGSSGESDLKQALCKVIRCGDRGGLLDLDAPPPRYKVAQPAAALATVSGNLAMVEGKPLFARRGVPNVPANTRFTLTAQLRAGALIRKKGGLFGGIVNVNPINAYSQFVVKLTVAMLPETDVVTADDPVMPDPQEFDWHTPVVQATGFFAWLRKHVAGTIAMVVLIAVVILVLTVPGFRVFVSALFGWIGRWITPRTSSGGDPGGGPGGGGE